MHSCPFVPAMTLYVRLRLLFLYFQQHLSNQIQEVCISTAPFDITCQLVRQPVRGACIILIM